MDSISPVVGVEYVGGGVGLVDTVVGLVVITVDLVGGVTIGNDGLFTGVVQSKTKDLIIKIILT